MKWGRRRYQNKDGSLTSAGKKQIGKKYEKASKKVMRSMQRHYNNMYLKSYNKAADQFNKGGINKFNAQQRKKYGDKFAEREGYQDAYMKAFDKELTKNLNKSIHDFYQSNKNFKKTEAMVEKYNMTKWNEMAKSNEAKIEDLRRAVKNNR